MIDDCWIWGGPLQDGYGRTRVRGRVTMTHRAVYEECVGPIPMGWQVDYLCFTRACYNPKHLEAVTPRVNIVEPPWLGAWVGLGSPKPAVRVIIHIPLPALRGASVTVTPVSGSGTTNVRVPNA